MRSSMDTYIKECGKSLDLSLAAGESSGERGKD